MEDFVVRFQGIPISASVEKGFLPTAVLEETGIIGSSFLVLLLFSISFPIFKYGKPWEIWMFATALLLNAGEAMLLSPGGKGLLIWIVIGFCYCNALHARQAAIRVHARQAAIRVSGR